MASLKTNVNSSNSCATVTAVRLQNAPSSHAHGCWWSPSQLSPTWFNTSKQKQNELSHTAMGNWSQKTQIHIEVPPDMAPENLGPTSNLDITSGQSTGRSAVECRSEGGGLHCTCSDTKFVSAQLEGPPSHNSVGGSVGIADPFFLRQVQFERKLSFLCYCCTVNYRRRKWSTNTG
jgi:hypothetical protein